MIIFIKKTILFIFILFIFFQILYIIKTKSVFTSFDKYQTEYEQIFLEKLSLFHDHIENRKRINLILGSSHIERAIIPKLLGENWFSFTNGSQNIYDSYKFVEYLTSKINMDTILVSIEPYDFPYSYIHNRKFIGVGNYPRRNPDFRYFGTDSIYFVSKKQKILRTLQNFTNNGFYKIDPFVRKSNFSVQEKITKQGFLITNYKKINLNSLYQINPLMMNRHNQNFHNVKSPPNTKYFKLFNELCEKNGIVVIYLITPKSIYYFKNLQLNGYDVIWGNILDSLANENITLMNFENFNERDGQFDEFYDEVHISIKGSVIFTELLKRELYK
jgi:hypothetical protein